MSYCDNCQVYIDNKQNCVVCGVFCAHADDDEDKEAEDEVR